MSEADLPSATTLAAKRKPRLADESNAYAKAREALLAEEIDLRRQIEAVAAKRRALPEGPEIAKDYRFRDDNGAEASLADLFGDKGTLVAYFWMYGPDRPRPCPMCTNFLGALNGNANDIRQKVALWVFGRSSVERQKAFAEERGWKNLRFAQTLGDGFALDFGGLDPDNGWEYPMMTVFRKSGDTVRLFWMGEMSGEMADPGQDPRGAPDPATLWTILDLTPEGRGADWYPKLAY